MVNKIPIHFYDWVFKNKDKININLLNDQFPINDLINEIKIITEIPDEKLCANFAFNGHLELLKYTHENGCKWNRDTCENTASNGHLEC